MRGVGWVDRVTKSLRLPSSCRRADEASPNAATPAHSDTPVAPTLRVDPGHTEDSPHSHDPPSAISDGLLALVRLVLAQSLVLIFVVSRSAEEKPALAVSVSTLYLLYAALLYALQNKLRSVMRPTWQHWADVAWILALSLPSGGLESPAFPYFFFPVVVASVRFGFTEGLRVTVAAALLTALAHFTLVTPRPDPSPIPALTHVVVLLMLGYLVARWGRAEIMQKRRMALLSDLARIPNPRLGPQQIMGRFLERVRAFYGAHSCLAVLELQDAGHVAFLADRDPDKPPLVGQTLGADIATHLLDLPLDIGVSYANRSVRHRVPFHSQLPAAGLVDPPSAHNIDERAETVAQLLEAPSFASVPLAHHGRFMGRLFLCAGASAFSLEDVTFLAEVACHITPMVENIHVLDRIATDATLHEREKISRDLHDSTIQPYIGLKLGLEALRRRVLPDDVLAEDLDDLIRMTSEGIAELREYVGGLRDRALPRETSLMHAVWRVAEKYREYYGIEIAVNANAEMQLNDRLAAEVFQILNEGLSNVRRHTASRRVTLNLRRQASELVVQIINHGHGQGQAMDSTPFRPRSIVERVDHLGGHVDVEHRSDGSTVVTAEIPL